MAEQTYFTVYADAELVNQLNVWADDVQRSRNNLVQMILSNAVKARMQQAAAQIGAAMASEREYPMVAECPADTDR